MSRFKLIGIRFPSGQTSRIASLKDIATAADQTGWPDDDDPELMRLISLVDSAGKGEVTPSAVYDAFVAVARKQGVLLDMPKSATEVDFQNILDRS